MRILFYFSCLVHFSFVACLSIAQKSFHKRYSRPPSNIECFHTTSRPGRYSFTSRGSRSVCGLYLLAPPNKLVQLTFDTFDIDCSRKGIMAIFDGWEEGRQIFPGRHDHIRTPSERYHTFCGVSRPQTFVSSQNVAQIQYRIPTPGQGFSVTLSFPENLQPCNIVSTAQEGTYTLRNHGRRVNCSAMLLSPERVELVSVDVGQSLELPVPALETGLIEGCASRSRDYVELLDGNGLEPWYMYREADLCGLASNPVDADFYLGCRFSVVRLVSSGTYRNSLTFTHRPLKEVERWALGDIEC